MWTLAAVSAAVVACGVARSTATTSPTVLRPAPMSGLSLEVIDAGDDDSGGLHTKRLSYEEACAVSVQAVFTDPNIPALTDTALHAPLADRAFLERCAPPEGIRITVHIVVNNGAALGVTVKTAPEDEELAHCVDAAIRRLRWSSSPGFEGFTVRY